MNHREIIQTVDLNLLTNYLQSRGWQEAKNFLENATIWVKSEPERGEFEILLPHRQNLGDYLPRMREILNILEEVEGRFQGEILSELTNSYCVIEAIPIKLLRPHKDRLSGTVILLGVVANHLEKIETELSDRDYILALEAYEERLRIVCQGNLIKTDNSYWLKNPHNFQVIGTTNTSFRERDQVLFFHLEEK